MNLVQFLNLASGTAANGANAGKSQISLIVMMVLLTLDLITDGLVSML